MPVLLEARLSDRVMRGSSGGPQAARTITRTISGRVVQKFHRSTALHRYDLKYGIKTKADFEDIREAFYVIMYTPYAGCRVKDWNDYQATVANSDVTVIAGSTYQLQRAYTFGGVTLLRKITKPVAGT